VFRDIDRSDNDADEACNHQKKRNDSVAVH
jgi:hypothetical protein